MLAEKQAQEEARIAALCRYEILDTSSEESFDEVTRLIAHICDAPIAVVNLVDRDRQFFKSEIGLGVRETPLDISICAHAILQSDLFIVPDLTKDRRFDCNPLVTGTPNLRFYAGALLKSPDGYALGTLCVLDYQTRTLTDAQKTALQTMARHVMGLLELRRQYQHEKRIAETLQRAMLFAPAEMRFPGLSVVPLYEAAWDEARVGGDFYDTLALSQNRVAFVVGDVAGKGLAAAARSAEVKYALRVYLRETGSPADAVARLNRFLCESQRLDDTPDAAFVALSVAVMETETGRVAITQAGMEPAILLRAGNDDNENTATTETVDHSDLLVGVFATSEYTESTLMLAPGDSLLLYTDGITEARRAYEFFGVEGVADIALRETQANRALPLADLGATIIEAARTFAGGQLADDACLLLVRCQSEELSRD